MSWRYIGASDAARPFLARLLAVTRHRRLLRRMAERDLRQRYVGTAAGVAWAAVYPLVFVAFYTAIFTFVFRGRVSADSPPAAYALYVVSGLLPWMAFSEVATRATQVMAEHRSLVKFAMFPLQILPLTSLYATALSQAVGIAALVLLTVVIRGSLDWAILWLVPIVALQALFLAGVAWLLGALGALVRDVKELVSIALMVGMFVTPIFYVERDAPGPLAALLPLNPMTHLVRLYRAATIAGTSPDLLSFGVLALAAVATLLLGFAVFERTRAFLGDLL